MKLCIVTAFFAMVLVGSFNLQAQDGFVIYAKNGGCERELHYRTITDGDQVGEAKLVVPKGPGADIWPVISYDGEWIAWCRSPEAFKGRYGRCDYHVFNTWEIYIARIDFGRIVPAEPIHVANGYLPSWGDDAKTPNNAKTLYFTHYDSKTIKKTTINPDGTFAPPEEYHKFNQGMGSNAHIQMSPDGKFLLYRPGGMKIYSLELKKNIISGHLASDHPCWGPRSKYFIIKQNLACFNTGTSVKKLGPAGVGSYFFGISNDAYWDEGKLWTIGKCGRYSGYGGSQNAEGSIEFSEVAIDGNGKWELGKKTVVDRGCSPDIHFFPEDFDPETAITTPKKSNFSDNRISFTTQIKTTASGLQLVVYSMDKSAKIAELFDMQGKRRAYIEVSKSFRTIIPLNGIANGRYLLQLNTNKVSAQKTVLISR